MPKVCIIYGFCEGPRMSTLMHQELKRAGHELTNDPYAADIVIAHSGGCFLVPHDLPASQVLMIGLTYWPGKSIARALVQKSWNDYLHHRSDRKARAWAKKTLWNGVYFWKMHRNAHMLIKRRRGDFWKVERLTLIRNEEDPFCTPKLDSIPFAVKPRYVTLPDQHDDCWLHPERVIAVIQ